MPPTLPPSTLNPSAPPFVPKFSNDLLRSARIRIGHINIRSLRHKTHEIKHLISKYNLHALAVSETWLDNSVSDSEVEVDGFTLYRHDRPCSQNCSCVKSSEPCRKAGGVCIYADTSLGFRQEPLKSSHEILLLRSRKKKNTPSLLVGCIYRPPSTPASYWKSLCQDLMCLQGEQLVLLGDLNVDSLTPGTPSFASLNAHLLLPYNLTNCISDPTRITPTSRTAIDYILSNTNSITDGTVHDSHHSDHRLICTTVQLPTPYSFPTAHHHSQQARRNFSGADMAVLTSLLEAANLCSFTSNTDVDTMFAEWLAKVDSALDVVAPHIVPSTKRHRLNPRRKCPFVTTELKDMIRCRKAAFRAYQRGGPTAATNFATFRRLRTQCNNMYRRLRNLHYESVCQEYRSHPRRLWATINYVTKRKPVTSSVLAASTSLNDHFHHIVHDPECSYHLPHGPAMQGALTSLADVTEQDVEYRLFTLKPGTAPGPDGLLPGFLKTMAAILAPSLARIFSSSLRNGIFPSAFKYANVTPILKSTSSDAFSPTSYRPISLTSILAKVLESIVLDQLASHMDPNDYLHDHQFGFRPHRSVHQLLTLAIHDWTLARDKGLSTAVAFVDLSKAFDRGSIKSSFYKGSCLK